MQLETVDAEVDLFEYGTEGDLYYMILEGIVEVWLPDPSQISTMSRVASELSVSKERLINQENLLAKEEFDLEDLEAQLAISKSNNSKLKSVIKIDMSLKETELTKLQERITKRA